MIYEEKPAILILHPLFLSGTDLRRLAVFSPLEKEYRLVYLDFARHGVHANVPFNDMQTAVERIKAELEDREPGISFAATLGLSLGARVALEIFAQEPLRYGKLFLDGIPLYDTNTNSFIKDLRILEFARKLSLICPYIVRKLIASLYGNTVASSMIDGMRNFDEESLKSLIQDCAAPLPLLNKTQIHWCLFCFGSNEADFKRSDVLFKAYPQARLKIFEGFDHIQYCAQHNDAYCSLVREFIENSHKTEITT